MTRRYRVDLAYDGTGYSGWQFQPDLRTVQGELERMLDRMGERGRPVGAGRTDAGVHAVHQVAHVDLERDWEPGDLTGALRGLSPDDLEVTAVSAVPDAFHARYGARSRTYWYALAGRADPFFRHRRWTTGLPPAGWVRECLAGFTGPQDCRSLAKTGSETEDFTCAVESTEWHETSVGALFRITANRFLYGMVRALTGTLVQGWRRGEDPGHVDRVLQRYDRSAAGEGAPAAGLYLAHVGYAGETPPAGYRRASVAQRSGLADPGPGDPGPGDPGPQGDACT